MKPNIIPCKEEKCILLPVCMNKKHIECVILNTLFCYMYDNLNQQEMWDRIREHFPKLKKVTARNPYKSRYRTFNIRY